MEDVQAVYLSIAGDVSTAIASAEGTVSMTTASLSGDLTLPTDIPYYTGEYEFTPAQQEQTISIQGKMATDDITINPIPSNYGRISWDGRRLTVE